MSKGHRAGGKLSGKHTTIIPAAEKVVDFLCKRPEVAKISVGFIKHGIKSGRHSIKVAETESGLFLKIRGTASIQEIWVYTKQKQKMQMIIDELFVKSVELKRK